MSSAGFQGIGTIGDEYNSLASIIQNLLSGGIHTAMLCQVLAVTNDGGVAPVGKVDLQPLVNQSGADGAFVPQGMIKAVPYMRLYGGTNAVIIDPKVGDIGIAIFCERDISSVIANQAQSNPGSGRQYNISDGLYINGFLGGATPTQYLEFNETGITILSPNEIQITAPIVNVNATTSVTVTTPIATFTVDETVQQNLLVNGNATIGGGATGTFGTTTGNTVTVQDGIVTNIY